MGLDGIKNGYTPFFHAEMLCCYFFFQRDNSFRSAWFVLNGRVICPLNSIVGGGSLLCGVFVDFCGSLFFLFLFFLCYFVSWLID